MTQESPKRSPETDPEEAAKVAQLCVREDNADALEDAAHALLSYARKLKAGSESND